MPAGDLLFYHSSGRWYEQVISRATHGPFVHVAVQVDDHHLIAAETWGIQYESLPLSGVTPHTLTPASKEAAEGAFKWLFLRLKRRYGWVDILDQGLKLLGSPLYLGDTAAYDCSDLAACFSALYTNDRDLMTQVLDHRQEISPNDLARYYGVK